MSVYREPGLPVDMGEVQRCREGYVKNLEFSDSPEKFLNAEDLLQYERWKNDALAMREPGREYGPIAAVITAILNGKKVVVLSNGSFSYLDYEKLDEERARQMYNDFLVLIKRQNAQKESLDEAKLRNKERSLIGKIFGKKITPKDVVVDWEDEARLHASVRNLNFYKKYGGARRVIEGNLYNEALHLREDGKNSYWGDVQFSEEEAIDLFKRFSKLKEKDGKNVDKAIERAKKRQK